MEDLTEQEWKTAESRVSVVLQHLFNGGRVHTKDGRVLGISTDGDPVVIAKSVNMETKEVEEVYLSTHMPLCVFIRICTELTNNEWMAIAASTVLTDINSKK